MSMEAICNVCGQEADYRFNFGDDWEAEREYHENYICRFCKERQT